MLVLTCLSVILGAVLGYRQTVVVLIPAIVLTLAVATGSGVIAGLDFWSTVLTITLAVTGLEMGYLASAATRVMALRRFAGPADIFNEAALVPLLHDDIARETGSFARRPDGNQGNNTDLTRLNVGAKKMRGEHKSTTTE